MTPRVGAAALITSLWVVGCGDSTSSPHPDAIVWDSAGIEIVELGPIDDRIAFRLSEEPEYVVGWEPDGYFFHSIQSGSLDSGGKAVLADGGSHQRIIVISGEGEVERLVGGAGSGPGEFQYLRSVFGQNGDILIAQESRGAGEVHITSFERDVPARTHPIPGISGSPSKRSIGIDNRGGLILVPAGIPGTTVSDVGWIRMPVIRVDLASDRVDTVLVYDLRGSDTGEVRGTGAIALSGDGFVVGRNDRLSVELTDIEGNPQRHIRWEEEVPVRDEEYWASYAEALGEIDHPGLQNFDEFVQTVQASGHYPNYFPNTTSVQVVMSDDRGNVWIAASTPYDVVSHYPRYRVFSSSGQWLGWVEIPERSHILAVRDGKVLLQRYDEYRVPAVALYRLEEVQ